MDFGERNPGHQPTIALQGTIQRVHALATYSRHQLTSKPGRLPTSHPFFSLSVHISRRRDEGGRYYDALLLYRRGIPWPRVARESVATEHRRRSQGSVGFVPSQSWEQRSPGGWCTRAKSAMVCYGGERDGEDKADSVAPFVRDVGSPAHGVRRLGRAPTASVSRGMREQVLSG
jgi:hypothetical protein